ncbi:MAG TPA: hypothetical protein VGL74_00775 [Terriglobales bacterium]|jgi:hypothetical protein
MTDDLKKKKKTYESPQVTIVSLRPEEAVLGHCKSNTSAGPVGSSCQGAGPACRGSGS